ncbi:MAG: GGDEF domain-containing protein [Oscillospiraceae bacterium]|nr:GGDEF domain-containing protein [Oscillospiraceae bacterium]
MINSRKTIGVFLCAITGEYKKELCRSISKAAGHLGYNVVFFSFIGTIGADYQNYGIKEHKMLDIIPFDELDGIIFENSNIFTNEIKEKIMSHIKKCRCPVVTIGEPCDEYYRVHIDNSEGIKDMVRHFAKHHGFKHIGFMSGIPGHCDAVERYAAFQSAMKECGLPEDGVGVFHGDFWYNKCYEAADFFLNKCSPRPQAVVCANDYMAYSLCDVFVEKGVNVPRDICVSGFDGIYEAKMHSPRITSAEVNLDTLSRTALEIIDNVLSGRPQEKCVNLYTDSRFTASCGCNNSSDDTETDKSREINSLFKKNTFTLYYIYDVEAAMLEMNRVTEIEQISEIFSKFGSNIGSYDKFFMFTYTDRKGRNSFETEIRSPSEQVYPAIWIDKSGSSMRPEKLFPVKSLIPADSDESPRCYYVSHIHFDDHCFGYAAISMENNEPFSEFYNIWIANIAVALESLLHKNSIRELVEDLEIASTHDKLTEMLNRRGFEQCLNRAFEEKKARSHTIAAAIVIDMDRLKTINDVYGHTEGDHAINSLAHIISACCTENEIAGRTGGDEFFVFAFDYSEEKAKHFEKRFYAALDDFNLTENKPYTLNASIGIYMADILAHNSPEEYLKRADERMYAMKREHKVRELQTRL